MVAPGTSFMDKLVSTTNSSTAGFVSGSTDQPSQALSLMAATSSALNVTMPPVLVPGAAPPPPEVPLPTSSTAEPAVPGIPAVALTELSPSLLEAQAKLTAKPEMQISSAVVFMGSLSLDGTTRDGHSAPFLPCSPRPTS